MQSGWDALNIATVLGEQSAIASESRGYLTQITLRWKPYADRIRFLDQEDRAVAMYLERDWQEFSSHVQESLTDACLSQQFDVPSSGMPLRRWAEEKFDSLKIPKKEMWQILRDPVALLQFGYSYLRPSRGESQTRSVDTLFGLACIGIGAYSALQNRRCKFCFRWAEPSQVFCAEHSQSKRYEDVRGAHARSYFIGKRTSEFLGWMSSPPTFSIYDHPSRMAILLAYQFWEIAPEAKNDVFLQIRAALAESSKVRAVVEYSKAMSDRTLEVRLRSRLDPLELWIEAWPEKIRLAEKWFIAEAHATPGIRGNSLKTDAVIAQAEKMALAGKTLIEIAEALGISRSAILKWCSRGRAPILKGLLCRIARSR